MSGNSSCVGRHGGMYTTKDLFNSKCTTQFFHLKIVVLLSRRGLMCLVTCACCKGSGHRASEHVIHDQRLLT